MKYVFLVWRFDVTHLSQVPYEDIVQDLMLIGIVGIEDPLREGVRKAVEDCQKAGVAVKMCTGDNVLTAHSIATQCGIFTAGGVIMELEGPVFRLLNNSQMLEIILRLQVLTHSSPEDKKILVEKLHAPGEIVGVMGDGTNDDSACRHCEYRGCQRGVRHHSHGQQLLFYCQGNYVGSLHQ